MRASPGPLPVAAEGLLGAPSRPREVLSWVLWPLLMVSSLSTAGFFLARGVDATLVTVASYVIFASLVHVLERIHPFERAWLESDGQVANDVVHTLLAALAPVLANVPMIALFAAGAQYLAADAGGALWPTHWPLLAQVGLCFVTAELATYWLHRSLHEVPWLWPFHAVHHSATRVWWLNVGRTHPLDAIWNVSLAMPLPLLMGVPDEVIVWMPINGIFMSMLSHSNIDTRCGLLDYVFMTNTTHYWHHSRDPDEGNRNYGPSLMLWDHVFGTFIHPDRRPPVNVGTDTPVPRTLLGQLVRPFTGFRHDEPGMTSRTG